MHSPGTGRVFPDLVAVGCPVVAHHLHGALEAVQLNRGRAVFLDREARRDDGVAGVAKVDQDVRVVVGGNGHRLALDDALRDRGADHARHTLGRAEQATERDDVVDAKVKQRTAARLVKPLAPVGTRPAVERSRECRTTDAAGSKVGVDRAIGGREDHVWSRYEVAGGGLGRFDKTRGCHEVCRHRLLDQDMLAGCERLLGESTMGRHRGEDQDDLDVGMSDHVVRARKIGRDPVLRSRECALLGPVVVDGVDRDVPIADQRRELGAIRPLEDVAESDDANADHASSVVSSRAVA